MVTVYHNWGRWVADCACGNAEHYGPDSHTGHVGGLTHTGFVCSVCDYRSKAVWPSDSDRIERLLAVRPYLANRNWRPGDDLVDENMVHGVGGRA